MTAGADGGGQTTADLEQVWHMLPAAEGQMLEAQRFADWSGGPVLVAVDASGVRHLLIALPTPVQVPRSSRGLHIDVRRLRTRQSDERLWMDLSCPESALHRLFSSLCEEILRALATTVSPEPAAVIGIIHRWRRFWTVPVEELSRDAQVGLLGELWLLTRWLPALTIDSVRAWVGPLGGRHDFACSEISVEVKTSGASSGPALHKIRSLDQLADPVVGALCLLSLRFIADPLGQISLDNLIEEARRLAASDDAVADELDQRLAGARWTPADRGRYETTWRLARQALYEVRDDFPRLTQESFLSSIPSGITDIGYTLDISVCEPWLVEQGPSGSSRVAALAGPR